MMYIKEIAQVKGVLSNSCTSLKNAVEDAELFTKSAIISTHNKVNSMLNPALTRIMTPIFGTYAGNMAGFIVATVVAVLIGMIILMYMINTAKDIAGNDTEMLTQIDRVSGIASIALFFAVLAGFVIAAKFIIDIVNGGGKGQGTM
ncbi:hypothetical protein [Methanothermococcus sp.]|uniref:hypothetical protein n=1 Tax=Methanothermococcus sp. TaxID=2614238 RepID=UPI0025FA8F32|nr:hypothetical protein [Methanothermococcus sp.]